MSESIVERLNRFTPDGSSLDRDALLFKAGRASARPNWRLRILTAALAATQLVTLAMLRWPRPIAPPAVYERAGAVFVDTKPQAPTDEEWALWHMHGQALATEGTLPTSSFVERLTPANPPIDVLRLPESLFH
jgi:hypothetical protein